MKKNKNNGAFTWAVVFAWVFVPLPQGQASLRPIFWVMVLCFRMGLKSQPTKSPPAACLQSMHSCCATEAPRRIGIGRESAGQGGCFLQAVWIIKEAQIYSALP